MILRSFWAKCLGLPITRSSKRAPIASITSQCCIALLASTVPCMPSMPRNFLSLAGYAPKPTLMGLGAYPASDKKFLGMLGMHGTVEANNAMQHCDVMLAIGARFDDRVIGNPKHFAQNERKIIHIDIDLSL